MAGVELATAYISLSVNTGRVKEQVRSAFDQAGSAGKAAGDRAGSQMAQALQSRLGSQPWVARAMERANRGAGAASSRKFFDEFRTTSSRIGAVTGLVVGKTIGAGITAGIKTVSWGASLFARIEVAAKRTAVKIGSMMAAAIKGALATTGVGLGVAGIAGAGGTLLSGLNRLKTLQQAEVQLSLKLSPAEVKKAKEDVLSVIEGTPIALDEAMQAVPRALSAGVKQGDELKQYIKDIGDTAASTGGKAGFGQIDLIFGQILGKGKLMGEELMQLTENGVDMRSALKDAFNWDDKTLQKNIAKGKVGMREVQIAVQKAWGKDGGLAQKMGETFEGATGNLKTSIAKLGANILGAIFGDPNDPNADPLENATKGVLALTERLDDVSQWVTDNRDTIHSVFSNGARAVGALFTALGQVKQAGSAAVDWLTRAWDNATTAVTRVRDTVRNTINDISQRLTDVVDTVKETWDSIFGEQGWFARQFQRVADLIGSVKEALGFGMPTANAAPGGSTTPFNPGPRRQTPSGPLTPGIAPGPTAGVTAGGLLGVGVDVSGNPLVGGLGGGGVVKSAGTPYGLPYATDTGGYGNPKAAEIFPEWVMQLGERFGVKPSTYGGHQGASGMNQGIDWVGSVEAMDAFARWLVQSKPPGLKQVIWQNPNTQFRVGSVDNRPVGPDLPDTTDADYYRRGKDDWVGHQDHVHTAWTENLDLSGFAGGGGVAGPGTSTSDSIPAWLSNGEHVLTAADVRKMGGQDGVYAFRAALQSGLTFNDGGAPTAEELLELQNQLTDLRVGREVAAQRLEEVLAGDEVSEQQKLQAQIAAARADRTYTNFAADLPILSAGGTPPDRSLQERVLSTDEDWRLQKAALDELRARVAAGDDVPSSQVMAAEGSFNTAQRERLQARKDAEAFNAGGSGGDRPDFMSNLLRTQGFTPSGGGVKAGTSSLAGFIGMGGEIVGGLIDTGASLVEQAAVAAATVGGAAAGGGGAAAGPAAGAAASYGVKLAAAQLKRVVNYGFELGGIGADAVIAQLFPLGGPPRWIGYDYSQMMPQLGIMSAATTTLEQMGQQALAGQAGQQQVQFPAAPPTNQPAAPTPAAAESAPQPYVAPDRIVQFGDPDFYNPPMWFDPRNMTGAGGGGGGGSWAKGGHVGVYDSGGVLNPGDVAVNLSTRPEQVLTAEQWDAMTKLSTARTEGPMVKIDAIYGMSPEDVANQIEAKQRLAAMRYTGRPFN